MSPILEYSDIVVCQVFPTMLKNKIFACITVGIFFFFQQNNGQKAFDFWKDIVAGIQHNYKMSAFKGK